MTVLVILALIFGVSAVLEGVAWAVLISLGLLAVAAWCAYTKVRGVTSAP